VVHSSGMQHAPGSLNQGAVGVGRLKQSKDK
jgi:hypothetical protein